MRFIKLILLSFIFLSVVITVISLFIPSHIRISRNIRINGTKQEAMKQINDPVKWKNWYPGADSLALLYINGEVKGIMLSNSQGLMITGTNDSIITAVNSGDSSKRIMTSWNIIPEKDDSSITIQWLMDLHLPWYPWEKFSSLLYERSYGQQMQEGLDKLKKTIEANHSSIN